MIYEENALNAQCKKYDNNTTWIMTFSWTICNKKPKNEQFYINLRLRPQLNKIDS